MIKIRTNENGPAETDDARSADTPQAKKSRDALAEKAERGLHKAAKAVAKDSRTDK